MSNWKQRAKPTAGGWKSRAVQVGVSPNLVQSKFPINEYPDFMDTGARTVVKNFGMTNPEGSLQYLRGAVPGVNFKFEDGEFLASKNNQDWYRVDPSKFTPGEIARDVLDVGYDVGSGALENLATLKGFGVGGPVGASLANSGASMATEAGRQALGEAFGIPGNMSTESIGLSGAVGLVAPNVTGFGNVKKEILNPKMLNQVASKFGLKSAQDVTQDHVNKYATSLGGKAADWVKQTALPNMGSFLSGETATAMRGYANNKELNDEMVSDQLFANSVIEEKQNRMLNFLSNRENEIGKDIRDSIRSSDGVQIKNVIDKIDEEIAILSSEFSDKSQERAAALKSWRDSILKRTYPDMTEDVRTLVRKETTQPDKVVESQVEYQMFPTTVTKLAEGRAPVWNQPKVSRDSLGMPKGASISGAEYSNLPVLQKGNGELPIYSMHDIGNGQRYHKIQDGVNPDKAQFDKEVLESQGVVSPDGFIPSLLQFQQEVPGAKKTATGRKVIPQEPKVEYVPKIETRTFNPGREGFFNKKTGKHEILPTSFGETTDGAGALELNRNLTSAAKWDSPYKNDIERVARRGQEELRQSLEVANPKTQDGKNAFKQLLAIEELVGTMGSRDEKGRATSAARQAFETEMGREVGKGKTTREAGLLSLEQLGYDLGRDREIIGGYRFAKNPSYFPISSNGSTSTSRSLAGIGLLGAGGTLLGYNAGGSEGALGGGAVGTALAGLTMSPFAMKKYIQGNNLIKNFYDKALDKTRTRGLVTPFAKDQAESYLGGWLNAD